MAAPISRVSITPTPKHFSKPTDSSDSHLINLSLPTTPWRRCTARRINIRPAAAVPDKLSGKVEESIKHAQEACSEDPVSGECKAAWDEVEELSAAASHARDRQKEADPLENYCKDNPETDECRTYDD
ncbi:calvin cycle protein CP12-1, chloroplastic-like [Salvia hispanica]|uniref:calvin cycle protein CP12-1, chloroplastic-like n=1 Tax=Salvia hispanica TaxID=49212 RepID=UPI0020099AF5|nr:calvin cycle protein CP12-1, chloroplastic-like [Salvia hispanica]